MTTTEFVRRVRRSRNTERVARPGGLRHTPISYVVLTALALYAGLPILMLLISSVKSKLELGQNPLGLPTDFQWSNFSEAWEEGYMSRGLGNSAIIVTCTILGVWVCAGLAGYAMARLDVPFKAGIAVYLFLVISLPVQIFLVPLFFLWSNLGLVNTLPGLILIYIATNVPFATLLLMTFMVGIPRELEEAARIDGANEWQVATRVILPLARPGFLTAGLVVGLAAYNELLFAVIFISDPDKLPISTAFLNLSSGYKQQYELVSAAGIIMITPVIILFLLMQKRFTTGLTSGGVKG